jgi:hypothetical protein
MLRGGGSRKAIKQLPLYRTIKSRFTRTARTSPLREHNSRIVPLSLPLQPDEEKGWRPYGILRGATKGLTDLSCHVSVLNRDRCPHLPHAHKEEVVAAPLREVDLIFPIPISQPGTGVRS